MKLSKETITVLKNFNQINPSIYFKKGSVISTISPSKTVMAQYKSSEEFEVDFGIYKLDKFLSVLSFFDDPEIEIQDKFLLVKSGKHEARIIFADPSILIYPKKEVKFPDKIDIEVNINEAHINTIMKSFAVMELPEIAFQGDGEKIYLSAIDSQNSTGDTYKIEIGETDKSFKAIFKVSNLKLIPMDYTVQISSAGISKFFNEKIEYFIAVEKQSEFK